MLENDTKSRSRRIRSVNRTFFSNSITRALMALNNGHIIAYPTEAVFGIGCDPNNEAAVLRLLALKQRPIKKGLILIASRYEQLKLYVDDSMLLRTQRDVIFSAWPGHVTFVFPVLSTTPRWLTGCFDSLAARITDHPMVVKLCEAFGGPLVSTSANITGLPPCRTVNEVQVQFGDTLPIVFSETGGYQNPSEIRDALTGKCLRSG